MHLKQDWLNIAQAATVTFKILKFQFNKKQVNDIIMSVFI